MWPVEAALWFTGVWMMFVIVGASIAFGGWEAVKYWAMVALITLIVLGPIIVAMWGVDHSVFH